jgi:hypothetical protein
MGGEDAPKRKRGRPKRQTTAPRSVDCIDWHKTAVEMRTRGHTYQQIADACGVSMSAAYKAVCTYLEQTRAIAREAAEEVRRLELDRLDRMLAAFGPRAEDGDAAAADRVLRIQERRAKLLGLDAPAESRTTVDAHPDTVRALMALVAK